MAEGKFFLVWGAITFTTHHKQLCAVDYVLYPSHRNVNNLGGGEGGGGASASPSSHLSMALPCYSLAARLLCVNRLMVSPEIMFTTY